MSDMNILFRNGKKYISRSIDWTDPEISQSVALWNDTFNIDYFSFRKRIRKYVCSVLKEQQPIKNIFICMDWQEISKFDKYKNQIFCPMDDDDIYLISDEEYDEVLAALRGSDCNGVLTGIYFGCEPGDGVFNYVLNPDWHKIDTNNLIYKNNVDVFGDMGKLPLYHTNSDSDTLHLIEMRHIRTSLHFVHPCSITSLMRCPNKARTIEMVELFQSNQDTSNIEEKFLPHVSNIIDIYSSLRW